MFAGTSLKIAAIQPEIPHSATAVQIYLPEGYSADPAGLTDERLKKEDAIVPMKGLAELFDSMLRMGQYIATQA